MAKQLKNPSGLGWQDVCYVSSDKETRQTTRRQIISAALDRVEARQNKRPSASFPQVSSRASRNNIPSASPEVYRAKNFFRSPPRAALSSEQESSPFHVEFGTEYYSYTYREPGLMRDRGHTFGLNGRFQYKPRSHTEIKSFKDASEDILPNVYRLETRVGWGKVDYESEGTGSTDSIKDVSYEVRGLLGYDLNVSNDMLVTPSEFFSEIDLKPVA